MTLSSYDLIQVRKWQKQQAGRQNYHRAAPIKSRDASVMVKADWIVVEEMVIFLSD